MEIVLKTTSKQAIGTVVTEFLSEWDLDLNEIRKTVGTHQEIKLTQDGVPVVYDLHISPLDDSGKQVTGYLIVLRNITHRVLLEDELKLKNEDLEAFSHMVAHDLKSPLGVIMGFSELLPNLLPEGSDAQLGNYLNVIHRTADKMDGIIQALLLLAHVREQDVITQNLTMEVIVAEVLDRLKYDIEKSEAVITKPESWPTVVGYDSWIEEVWANYISNGLKYGGSPPHLRLTSTVQEDGMVRFEVQDNGPGIKPEDMARLFTPFTRLDVEKADGHGLGLSIVQRIVTRLSGEVGVESVLDEGSVFYFTLPATAVSQTTHH